MLSKLKKSKSEGFTIIEVMIVLAIAGLILLIVFLAVPALQRNSRNTQRKTDIGRIGSAATTVVANNNGQMPTAANLTTNVQTEVGSNLAYYQSAAITGKVLVAAGTQSNPDDITKVTVVGNGICDTANPGDAKYAQRQIAVLYTTESGSGKADLCVDQ